MYELTIRMIIEEMCDWWSNNWGWYYPLQSTIDSIKDDRIFKLSLLKIKKRCMEEHGLGFIDFIKSFTGIPSEQKDKYFIRKFG
jgi:hypothetical protein